LCLIVSAQVSEAIVEHVFSSQRIKKMLIVDKALFLYRILQKAK